MLKLLFYTVVTILLQLNLNLLLAFNPGFVENKGQVRNQHNEVASEVLYILNTKDLKITLRENGFSYERVRSTWSDETIQTFIADEDEDAQIPFESHRIDFIFPNQPSEIEAATQSDFNLNYYAHLEHPITGVKQFKRVLYKNVANGIDVEFLVTDSGRFKYNILVAGSADLSSFFMRLSGADAISISKDGGLQIDNAIEQIKEEIPESFYVSNNTSENVAVTYRLEGDNLYFETSKDYSEGTLIIDPEPDLIWGSYFGGFGSDLSTGIVVDESDNIFQTGITLSANNISTTGAYQTSYLGDLDVYLSKFDLSGTLLWSTYYGNIQSERAYSVTVDEEGNSYLGGSTFSENGIATTGAFQEYLFGGDDMFIVKFTENGLREWGTYYGGNAHDFITEMEFFNNRIFLTGHSTSSNNISTSGAYLESFTANECGFVACLESDGSSLVWGTYFGEELSTSGEGLEVFDGYLVMTGRTTSNLGIASTDAHQENHIGFVSGFLTLFDVDGNYQWGTYYGGDFSNVGESVTVDELNNIYLAGKTNSPNNIATPGAYQSSRSDEHGFLAKFNFDGERIWGTYVGGNLADYINKLDYNSGTLLIGGQTLSTEEISSAAVYQEELNDGFDIFFKLFDTAGVYQWGTYYGGEINEDLFDMSFLSNGNFCFVGNTTGSQNGIATAGSHQDSYGGGPEDGVIGLFCVTNALSITYENGFFIADGGSDLEWFYNGESIEEYTDTIESLGDGTYYVTSSTDGKCESTSDEYVLNTVSVASNQQFKSLRMYPNPVRQNLTLLSEKPFQAYRISDLTGREIVAFTSNDFNETKMDIDVSFLKNGLYIIQVEVGSDKQSVKFIKQ